MSHTTFSTLSDSELLATVRSAAAHEREATSKLVASLSEVDARRLYLGEGYSSMFTFCTGALHMSEHAAYSRIEAARLARRFPAILPMLVDGRLSLTNLGLLAPHLDRDEGRCAFVGNATRCEETGFLEFHHVIPFGLGGPNSVENIELRCRAHNQYEAERPGLAEARPEVN